MTAAVQSGWNDDTPNDLLLDTAVVAVDEVVVGVSRGGISIDPQIEMRNVPYDGQRSPTMGLDRRTMVKPKVSGKFLQVGPGNLRQYEPGASGTGLVVTVPESGALITEYLANVTVTFRRSGGGFAVLSFPNALSNKYAIASTDNSEVEVDWEIGAVLDRSADGASDGTPPYGWTLIAPA